MANQSISLRRVVILLLLAVVVTLGAVSLLGRDLWQPARAQSTPIPTVEEDSQVVIAEGRIVPHESAWLSFNRPGRVVEVLVEAGQPVSAGTPLVRLGDIEAVEAAVAAAELESLNASQALDELIRTAPVAAGGMRLSQAQAERALIDARLQLDTLDTDEFQTRVDDAWEAVLDARDDLDDAQEELDKVSNLDPDNDRRTQAEDVLEQAQTDYDDRLREHDLLLNELESAQAAVQQARAALAEARREYEAWKDGPDPEKLALAEARQTHAQAQLDAARTAREDMTLAAPFDGVVSQVNIVLGEQVAPNQPVIRLADFSALYVETSDLTELDVVNVRPGSTVILIPDALPDVELEGVVESIGQDYQERAGDVLYTVRIRLLDPDVRLLWGMTVEVHFEPE